MNSTRHRRLQAIVLGALSVGMLLLALRGAPSLNASGTTFVTTGSMAGDRWAHSLTTLADGRVLVAGGRGAAGETASAEIYDPATGTWEPTGSLLAVRAGHTATLLQDGRVLIYGGDQEGPLHTHAEIFDPAAIDPASGRMGRFEDIGVVTPRIYHSATLLQSGKVLIAGGSTTPSISDPVKSAEIYDPLTRTVTSTGSLNVVRNIHSATLLLNGTVLIAGGGPNGTTSAEIYDPTMEHFTLTDGSLHAARAAHSATLLLDGRVLLAGGGNNGSPSNDAEVYDPGMRQFTLVGSMATARSQQPAVRLASGAVLIAGGGQPGGGGGEATIAAELFDPATNAFSATASLNVARWVHQAALLADGRVLIAGGRGSDSAPLTSAELYLPPAPVPTQLYLRSQPAQLALSEVAPTSTSAAFRDSASVNYAGGNPWVRIDTWATPPGLLAGTLTGAGPVDLWLGLKNSDDQGTYFDIRAELLVNGQVVEDGRTLCVQGITRNPAKAKNVSMDVAQLSQPTLGPLDTLELRVSARIGTNADGSRCGGHSNAVGLRLYFDAASRASSVIVSTLQP